MNPPSPSASLPFRVALVGNPNTGKTTLFNRLTGLRQRVGNFPGVTVEQKTGRLDLPDGPIEILDLPGTYSLSAQSRDEAVVVETLHGRFRDIPPPDAVVCIADATNLQRHLFLALQLVDQGLPMILVLNLWDDASRQGLRIDTARLSERLSFPVIPTVATTGAGLPELKQALGQLRHAHHPPQPCLEWPDAVTAATTAITESVHTDTGTAITSAEARRILFDATPVIAQDLHWSETQRKPVVTHARSTIEQAGYHPLAAEALILHARIRDLLDGVVHRPHTRPVTTTERIDRLLTHRVWGLTVFFAVMFLVFYSVYRWAGPLMDGVDAAISALQSSMAPLLESTPILQSLVIDGLLAGVGSVIIFLPQILILFFFIALLEDTGYMARAAFLMDRLFSWCGLNGRSFVPMLTSYACAIPGVMATRTIEDPKVRITTMLITPLMSCSARLPVYVLMIGAFIEPRFGPAVAAFTLFAFHLLGLFVAIPIAWVIHRFLLKTRRMAFVLEMPAYRLPRLGNALWRMAEGGRSFLRRAGTLILLVTVILWALASFPTLDESSPSVQQHLIDEPAERHDQILASLAIESSYLGRAGHALQPLFAPAGFDWRITVGVLASFPAREVIIATLGILYSLGDNVDEESPDLRDTLSRALWVSGPQTGQPVFTLPVVFAIMVFFALCMQCGATLITIAKESRPRWAVLTFAYMTTLAWLGAVATYQLLRHLTAWL